MGRGPVCVQAAKAAKNRNTVLGPLSVALHDLYSTLLNVFAVAARRTAEGVRLCLWTESRDTLVADRVAHCSSRCGSRRNMFDRPTLVRLRLQCENRCRIEDESLAPLVLRFRCSDVQVVLTIERRE